jgi:hypothetical protein
MVPLDMQFAQWGSEANPYILSIGFNGKNRKKGYQSDTFHVGVMYGSFH